MTARRVFMDTAYIQALLNRRDRYHHQAVALWPAVRAAEEVWLTEAVLTEVGNGMSAIDRAKAVEFIRQCYRAANMHVVPVDASLFARGLDLYASRTDKEWGLTDCISFVVMGDESLQDALTSDHHFVQAGHRALMERL